VQNNSPPVDVVYTWVNHRDPGWQALHRAAMREQPIAPGEHPSARDAARFTARNELYYSIASIHRYAPWVRHIYVVTNCELPPWAAGMHDLSRVGHEELFADGSRLPTFNSKAIESTLHRIGPLSETFLYFNDDVFLCTEVQPADFFQPDGTIHFFPSRHDIPYNAPSDTLRPVDTGAINAARLLERDFAQLPRKKLHHTPCVLTKSMLRELEQRYPEEVQRTRSHPFRHPDDIPMATTLHAYYAQYTGRGIPRGIAARYIDIGDWRFLGLVHPWSPLMRGKYTTLCLNEVAELHHFRGIRDRIVESVMSRLFATEAAGDTPEQAHQKTTT
jgi:hypothetical protein